MKEPNYLKLYSLEKAIEESRPLFERKGDLKAEVEALMKLQVEEERYRVRKPHDPRHLTFGRLPYGAWSSQHKDMLVLSTKNQNFESLITHREEVVGLAYKINSPIWFLGENAYEIIVNYIQTLTDINMEKYNTSKDVLGARPHEFLLAHFLARLAPVLDAYPETDVQFDKKPRFCDGSVIETHKGLYESLRDRFMTKRYKLNPRKERVRQILGLNNRWIQERLKDRENRAKNRWNIWNLIFRSWKG